MRIALPVFLRESIRHFKVCLYILLRLFRMFTIWSETESKGIAIPYPNISLHATKARGARGKIAPACIYMHLNGAANLKSKSTNESIEDLSEEKDKDGETDELVEMHLTPRDESTCTKPCYRAKVVSAFYEGLSACASLHSDTPSSEDEAMSEKDYQWITAADDVQDADEGEPFEGAPKWRRTE
jgi:hypothetical protein